MATITKFEDLEIWQLARIQSSDFEYLANNTSLSKDYELKNQMNASSGSVMDCIAGGFERSGNQEFKYLIIITKCSNGEYRSQLYRCMDRMHISIEKFNELYTRNVTIGSKIMSFINYLQKSRYKGESRKPKGT